MKLILKLILKNFMKHESLVVEFGKGISWVDGPNGCGKSSIFEALRFVLGFEPRNLDRHQERIIRLGQKSCKVTLEAGGYVIERSKSKSTHKLKIVNESLAYQSDCLDDIKSAAVNIFGIKYDILRLIMKPFPFSELEDRQTILKELALNLEEKVIADILKEQTKLDDKSALYCADVIRTSGIDELIDIISESRIGISREIIRLDTDISVTQAILEEKSKTSESIQAQIDYNERELKCVDDEINAQTKAKEAHDKKIELAEAIKKEIDAKMKIVADEKDEKAKRLQELIDNVEKHWIPDDLPVIRCKVIRDQGVTDPVLRVGPESEISEGTADLAVLPDASQWDEGPLTAIRNELRESIISLDQELNRLVTERENSDKKDTKEISDDGNPTGDIIFSSQRLDSLGARRSVLLGGIEALRRQLAQKFTGSKAISSGESVPATSGETLPGPSETPLNTLNTDSQAANQADTSPMVNEIETIQLRVEELRCNRAKKQASYDKYDLLIRSLGAKGSVQKALASRTISVLNESLAKHSQVFFEGVPALPLVKIDENGNVESEGVMSELRSVGERLVDCAQLACSISLNMRIKSDVCTRTFIVDDLNDLDKSRKESLLAWSTLLRDDFDHIVLATCGIARPSAPDGLIKFIGLR